MHKPSLKTTDQ